MVDNLGSPRVITNSSGNVVSRHDYMPFGEELGATVGGRTTGMGFSGSGDNNRKKFTGYQHDNETGLDFANARFYGNTQGRFTSPDPFSGSATIADPQTFNRYAYCRNNPVNSTDPTGLMTRSQQANQLMSQRSASVQYAMDIVAEGEAAYVQQVADAFAAAAEAAFLNAAVAAGTMTSDEAADIAAGNPNLAVEHTASIALTDSTLALPQNPTHF